MAITSIVGNDGSITMANAEDGTVHGGLLNRWRARCSYVTSEVTGFTDVKNRRNRLGLLSVEGSASGTPQFDAAVTAPQAGPIVASTSGPSPDGNALVLTSAAGCTWTFTAAIHAISMDMNKIGDALLTFDFMNGDADDFAEAWDEA